MTFNKTAIAAMARTLAAPQADAARAGQAPPAATQGVVALFESAVTGVQSAMPHLAQADIIAPPHQWFDAALARQIAIHLMANKFGVPKRKIALQLERSRASVNQALKTVEERMAQPEFSQTYEVMARKAASTAEKKGGRE